MSLSNINSNCFHQYQQAIIPFSNNHIVQQKQKHLKEQVIWKLNKKAEQALNPSPLLTLPRKMVGEIAKFLSIKDQVNLVSTCEILRGKHRFANPGFNIDTIKNAFEDEVTQFINLFRDENENFKHSNDIANEINNGTIILSEDPSVLKKGFKVVFSNMDDAEITDLLAAIKNKISQDKIEGLASVAITKMSNDYEIRMLLLEIKDNISQDKLYELASIAIEKMSDDYAIMDLLENINENLSTIQLENLRDQINPETPKACCTIM